MEQSSAINSSGAPHSTPIASLGLSADDLVQVTCSVCEGLFGIHADPTRSTNAPGDEVVLATIRYDGAWQAKLSVESGVNDAIQLASRLMGDLDDPVLHAKDLVGELSNVLAGKLKCALPRGVDNDVPQTSIAAPSPAPSSEDLARLQQQFTVDGSGSLVVTFETGAAH